MSTDDLDRWLEALRGRDEDGNSDSVEGRALRAQIRARPRETVAAVAEIDSAREAQLIARARAAGLLPSENATPRQARTKTPWRLPRAALIAATLAGVVIGVASLRYTMIPTETFRGAANGVVELEAADPRALKQRLIQELRDAGVNAGGYERLNRVGVDADLPVPVPTKVRRVLEHHHIPVPSDGALVVEIRSPGAQ
jgi:hypothetical protein